MAHSGHPSSKKDAYLGLCHNAVLVDDGKMRVWLEKENGAKCYALSARKLSLPWEDGEFSWRWTPYPLSRTEVTRLVHEAMDGNRGNDMRVNAMLWKEKARAAAEDCGSSG